MEIRKEGKKLRKGKRTEGEKKEATWKGNKGEGKKRRLGKNIKEGKKIREIKERRKVRRKEI